MNCPPDTASKADESAGRPGPFTPFFDPYNLPPPAPWGVANPYRFRRHQHNSEHPRCTCKNKTVTSADTSPPPDEGTGAADDIEIKKDDSLLEEKGRGDAVTETGPKPVVSVTDAVDSGTENSDSSSPEDGKGAERASRHQSSLPLRKRTRHH